MVLPLAELWDGESNCSSWLVSTFVNVANKLICAKIMSSLTHSHLAAMSDNKVFKQNVNLSATGISRKKKNIYGLSKNNIWIFICDLLSDLYILTSSSQTTFANPFNSLTRYGIIFVACWKFDSNRYMPKAITASCPLWSILKMPWLFSWGQSLWSFSTWNVIHIDLL